MKLGELSFYIWGITPITVRGHCFACLTRYVNSSSREVVK